MVTTGGRSTTLQHPVHIPQQMGLPRVSQSEDSNGHRPLGALWTTPRMSQKGLPMSQKGLPRLLWAVPTCSSAMLILW